MMMDCFVDIDVTPISDVTGSLLDYHGGGQPPFLENKPARTQELKEQQLKMEKIFIEQEEVMRDAKEKGFKLLSL